MVTMIELAPEFAFVVEVFEHKLEVQLVRSAQAVSTGQLKVQAIVVCLDLRRAVCGPS